MWLSFIETKFSNYTQIIQTNPIFPLKWTDSKIIMYISIILPLEKNSWNDFEIPKVFEIILEWQHIFILSDVHFFYTRQFIFGFL